MKSIYRLLEIMRTLRDPDKGCLWDREQDFTSIAPYTIEEAYEVADAITNKDMDSLCSELGDLLFQVVYHARMAEESGYFRFEDIVDRLNNKLEKRHPRVYGEKGIKDAKEQSQVWEKSKISESRLVQEKVTGLLDGVSRNLPALRRAHRLQVRASGVGFDWDNINDVIAKVEEEFSELKLELENNNLQKNIREEIGDLLFACVNLARYLNIDAETALLSSNNKFEKRFRYIEEALAAQGKKPENVSLEVLDSLWEEAKLKLRSQE